MNTVVTSLQIIFSAHENLCNQENNLLGVHAMLSGTYMTMTLTITMFLFYIIIIRKEFYNINKLGNIIIYKYDYVRRL